NICLLMVLKKPIVSPLVSFVVRASHCTSDLRAAFSCKEALMRCHAKTIVPLRFHGWGNNLNRGTQLWPKTRLYLPLYQQLPSRVQTLLRLGSGSNCQDSGN